MAPGRPNPGNRCPGTQAYCRPAHLTLPAAESVAWAAIGICLLSRAPCDTFLDDSGLILVARRALRPPANRKRPTGNALQKLLVSSFAFRLGPACFSPATREHTMVLEDRQMQ